MAKLKKLNAKQNKEAAAPKEIKVNYIKSNSYFTQHADGIFGGEDGDVLQLFNSREK